MSNKSKLMTKQDKQAHAKMRKARKGAARGRQWAVIKGE